MAMASPLQPIPLLKIRPACTAFTREALEARRRAPLTRWQRLQAWLRSTMPSQEARRGA